MPDVFYIYVSTLCVIGFLASLLYSKIENVAGVLVDCPQKTSNKENVFELLKNSPLIENQDDSPQYTERLS